jgi:hypothetical protein
MKYRSLWDNKLISVTHNISKLMTRWKFNNRKLAFLLKKNYNTSVIRIEDEK